MLSEKGSLKETPPIKLLLTVFEQGLTGILYVKREDILKVLYFSRGKLIWAISNSEEDKLENILLAKNIVDPPTLQKVKKESHVSESIGKLLVERGLITLEELIECSKDQLKRIIFDVLKWKDGGFQFMKDAPPERLLSLDLNVTDFVIKFIIEEMDVSDIWKTIGSLQIELIKNPDEEKMAKYHLSDKQKELLNGFDGENKLEAVLTRHSGGHRESILKIIYFFLMAELLIKKEFELSDLSAFEVEKELDYLDENALRQEEKKREIERTRVKPSTDDVFEGIPSIHTITRKPSKEYVFGDEESANKTGPPRKVFDFDEEEPKKPPVRVVQDDKLPIVEEKKKRKLLNLILILVFLILVIGGVILIILPWLENESPLESMKGADKKASETTDIIKIEEKKPVIPEEAKITEPDSTTETTKTSGKETPEEKKENPKPTEVPLPASKTAESYFKEGNLITAGDVWRKELEKNGIKYTILLEMDRMKESVMYTYNRFEMKKEFFIINKREKSGVFYLVMWGKFKTQQEATNALKLIPNYFWKQKEPPEVVDLARYR